MIYKIMDRELVIEDSSGKVFYKGKPSGNTVDKIITDSEKGLCIVLFDKNDRHKTKNRLFGIFLKSFRNLVSVDSHGKIIWKAKLPKDPVTDWYNNVLWSHEIPYNKYYPFDPNKQYVIGFTVSGYLVVIDPYTGKIISQLLVRF